MRTHITDTPAQDAGIYIKQKIEAHLTSGPVLFLLSGGSALSVLTHTEIHEDNLKSLTITTTDERFTTEVGGNNFLQLQETSFFKETTGKHAHIISTELLVNETYEAFTNRIRLALERYYEDNPNAYTIGLFGIGEDGHTASIFPMSEEAFTTTFGGNDFYTNTRNPTHVYPYRTTVTPAFIEEHIDNVVLFAVGSNKCDNILNYMHNKNFSKFQIPALIPAQHPESILFTDCKTLI